VIGQTVAQYKILARLGEGATGVVYQAEHATLRHLVAIKFLRAELMLGETARDRFLREAEIAASLDSPGVCSVIDYGEHDGRVYLVMRYCPGASLRDRIAAGPLAPEQAVLFAIQIAEGLAAAHASGVVHRDIKPSNIVISGTKRCTRSPATGPEASTVAVATDGGSQEQAKIIDFGLALLPQQTRLTGTGGRLGTPAYMAPEQVAGESTDQRTDLWALGAVLHEMVTGRPPFAGDHAGAVMHAIRTAEPRLMAQPDPAVPAKLTWIIGRALQKDPARRYPDAEAMLRDLRILHADLNQRSRDLPSWVVARRRWLGWFGAGILVLAGGTLALILLREPTEPARGLPPGKPVPLTSGVALDVEPAISPDGSRIAFTSRVDGQADIYVVDAHGGDPLRLTDDPRDDYSPAWFPDGSSLAFVSERRGSPDIWKTGQHGGGATLLLADARDPALAPDGLRLAFIRTDSLDIGRVGVVTIGDPASLRMLTGLADGLWDHRDPCWSPDGQLICYGTKNDLWLVAPETGVTRRLTRDGREDCEPCWSPDGLRIYFSSYRDNVRALWRISLGASAAERLTLGGSAEVHPSLAADGRVLAYGTRPASNVDLLVSDRRGGRQHRFAGQYDDTFPSLSPDGRLLAFTSDRRGDRAEVWLQTLVDGQPAGAPRRLTEQAGHASQPAVSPDGRWVAYYCFDGEERDLWIVATDGGQPNRVTEHPASDVQPAWSPDGSQLAFASDRAGGFAIWILPVADGLAAGPPRRLTADGVVALVPVWSPDGAAIAYVSRGDAWIMASRGTQPARQVTRDAQVSRIRWERATDRLWIAGRWNGTRLSLRTLAPASGDAAIVEPAIGPEHPDQSHLYFDISADAGVLAWTVESPRGRLWLLRSEGPVF
jgi:Tol biopolymer transport system component/serine/threonine protein kinase